MEPKVARAESEDELRWRLRESQPSFKFRNAVTALGIVRQAQGRLGNSLPGLNWDMAAKELKNQLYKLIDEL